jgi:glycosyltransferase involved in cell wall biosynthesis
LQGKHELHLIAVAESETDLSYQEPLEAIFDNVEFFKISKIRSYINTLLAVFGRKPLQVSYFKSNRLKKHLQEKIARENYNAIHVQHLRMSQFLNDNEKFNVILDLPDAFSLYWKRRSENARNKIQQFFAYTEYKRLLEYEKRVLPTFPLNLVCSAEDLKYLQENSKATISILPNGVDTDMFCKKPGIIPTRGRVLFTGNMDYEPNIDAVCYFVEEIWPIILKEVPSAQFVIAGQRPVTHVKNLASDTIHITGFVEDISLEYAKAEVVVAPLRFGAGTQNKVLEAIAVGTPVVCTEIGFKGLELESGQGAILANGPVRFANTVIQLLHNEELRRKDSNSGSDIIHSKFGWKAVALKLEQYLAETGR